MNTVLTMDSSFTNFGTYGADDDSRNHTSSLENSHSTVKLHPHKLSPGLSATIYREIKVLSFQCHTVFYSAARDGAAQSNRSPMVTHPSDFESVPVRPSGLRRIQEGSLAF